MERPTGVLIADRDAGVLEVTAAALADCLAGTGYRVVPALGWDDVVAALGREHFALVLSDSFYHPLLGEPTSHWAHLDRLRALAGPVPFILSSAYAEREFAAYAAHGCAAFLAKPFELDDLCRLVRRHLGLPPRA